jgi:hypothetical protein
MSAGYGLNEALRRSRQRWEPGTQIFGGDAGTAGSLAGDRSAPEIRPAGSRVDAQKNNGESPILHVEVVQKHVVAIFEVAFKAGGTVDGVYVKVVALKGADDIANLGFVNF